MPSTRRVSSAPAHWSSMRARSPTRFSVTTSEWLYKRQVRAKRYSPARITLALITIALVAPAVSPAGALASSGAGGGIHKIRHVVVIMQENRSFDSYFGTFPGADGIPRDRHGNPTVCVPDPAHGGCIAPYHDTATVNHGEPHAAANATAAINGGRIDRII